MGQKNTKNVIENEEHTNNKKQIKKIIVRDPNVIITKEFIELSDEYKIDGEILEIGLGSKICINGVYMENNSTNGNITISSNNGRIFLNGVEIKNIESKETQKKKFYYSGEYEFNIFDIVVIGAGKLKIQQWMIKEFKKRLRINISGSRELELDDIKVKKCDIISSGSSEIIGKLEVDEIYLNSSGSSDVSGITAKKKIDVDVSGSSDVYIKRENDNVQINKSKSGSGKIYIE